MLPRNTRKHALHKFSKFSALLFFLYKVTIERTLENLLPHQILQHAFHNFPKSPEYSEELSKVFCSEEFSKVLYIVKSLNRGFLRICGRQVLYIVTLYSENTRALTFENSRQTHEHGNRLMRDGNRRRLLQAQKIN